jgi:hypothetical protein
MTNDLPANESALREGGHLLRHLRVTTLIDGIETQVLMPVAAVADATGQPLKLVSGDDFQIVRHLRALIIGVSELLNAGADVQCDLLEMADSEIDIITES